MLSGRWQGRSYQIGLNASAALAPVIATFGAVAAPIAEADLANAPLLDARGPLILGIILGVTVFALTAAVGFLRATRRARSAEQRANSNTVQLEGELDVQRAILSVEPQILIYWGKDGAPHLAADMLDPNLGVPQDLGPVLNFESWLGAGEAQNVRGRIEKMRGEGTPFNVMLKTSAGSFVEIDGRAGGSGAVMKIRDLAGQRAQLSRICARHDELSFEIGAARALLDALETPAWVRDAEGTLQWVNRAYASAVGAADSGEVHERQIELFGPAGRAQGENTIAKGEIVRARLTARGPGEGCEFEVTMFSLGAASAGLAVPAARGVTTDGPGAVSIEAHTRTLNRIATAVAVFSRTGRLTYFNQAFLDLWRLDDGWLAERPEHGQILDHLRAKRLLPEQTDYRAWKGAQVTGGGVDGLQEDWWHLPDGRSIHVLVDRASDGGQTFLYEDATERLTLESQYNSLIQVQKETLDNLQEGVAVFASDGRLKLVNRAFARIWNLEHQALGEQPHIDDIIERCRVLHDDDAAWDEVKTAGTSIDDERRSVGGELARPDGSVLAYSSLPLPDGAMLLTYVDVTDTKRAERALIERNEALEAAGRLKSTFISHISYELRVPLTNIIGFSDLLAMPTVGSLSETQHDYLDDIRTSGGTLLTIIDDILDLATIDAGALELRHAKVRVGDVVEAAVLGVRDRVQRAKLDLTIDIEDAATTFEADAQRVRQVLYNLLENAIGFSVEGGVVSLEARREGEMIAFLVADQGVGIAPGDQTAAFERFESKAQGSKHHGAGLGLSIVKSLVELHGGDVDLQSAPGEGTRVTVRFPLAPKASRRDGGPDAGKPAQADDASSAAA